MCPNNGHMWHDACPASMAPAVSLDLAPNLWCVCNSVGDTQSVAMNFYIWASNCMDTERTSCLAAHFELAEKKIKCESVDDNTKLGCVYVNVMGEFTVASWHWWHLTTCCSRLFDISIIAWHTRHVTIGTPPCGNCWYGGGTSPGPIDETVVWSKPPTFGDIGSVRKQKQIVVYFYC